MCRFWVAKKEAKSINSTFRQIGLDIKKLILATSVYFYFIL